MGGKCLIRMRIYPDPSAQVTDSGATKPLRYDPCWVIYLSYLLLDKVIAVGSLYEIW